MVIRDNTYRHNRKIYRKKLLSFRKKQQNMNFNSRKKGICQTSINNFTQKNNQFQGENCGQLMLRIMCWFLLNHLQYNLIMQDSYQTPLNSSTPILLQQQNLIHSLSLQTKDLKPNKNLQTTQDNRMAANCQNKIVLCGIMNQLFLLKTKRIFDRLKPRIHWKLPLLLIRSKANRFQLQQGFKSLKQILKTSNPEIIRGRELINEGDSKKGKIPKLKYNEQNIIRKLALSNYQVKIKMENVERQRNQLQCKLIALQKQQQKERQKKKQSLQMLGEDIYEKNLLIKELQQTIKTLQAHSNDNSNFLDENPEQLIIDRDRLESVNQKLNCLVNKKQNQIDKVIAANLSLEAQLKNIETENRILRESNFNLKIQLEALRNRERQIIAKGHRYDQKILKVGRLQQRYNDLMKNTFDHEAEDAWLQKSQKKTQDTKSSIKDINYEDKLEAVLDFIYLIRDPAYQLRKPNLFDEDQTMLLTQLKASSCLLNQQQNLNPQSVHPQPNSQFQSGLLNVCGIRNSDDSILKAFQDSNEITIIKKRNEINLQTYKQMVAELKSRILSLRYLIHTLLTEINISPYQNSDTLKTILEFFQYSEDERDSMLSKKGTKKVNSLIKI